jgi:cephalosporin hydroxylase
LGRPVIQLPEDLLRLQELVVRAEPDVIVETGVAHGGSLVFHASLCRALGRGRVIGVDVEIRPHNRTAIEAHPLADLITLVEGDSAAADVVAQVAAQIGRDERVMVVLDAAHSREHVARELEAYAPMAAVDSYVVAMDGHIMRSAAGLPRTQPGWVADNPNAAVADFAERHDDFVREQPAFTFSESPITEAVSYFTGGVLRRVR